MSSDANNLIGESIASIREPSYHEKMVVLYRLLSGKNLVEYRAIHIELPDSIYTGEAIAKGRLELKNNESALLILRVAPNGVLLANYDGTIPGTRQLWWFVDE